ncbi:hypothetical protein [Hyphomicrobium sp.]|uniref:hypothetical protein n=1 Tax=Hyphomicrobium sp. TaxID=82 RepID=UPI003566B894
MPQLVVAQLETFVLELASDVRRDVTTGPAMFCEIESLWKWLWQRLGAVDEALQNGLKMPEHCARYSLLKGDRLSTRAIQIAVECGRNCDFRKLDLKCFRCCTFGTSRSNGPVIRRTDRRVAPAQR